MGKAEIGWKTTTDEGIKREVYARHFGDRWEFYEREKRFDCWQRITEPPLEDWKKLLDAVRRRIARRLVRPEEEARVKKTISEKFPGTNL